MCIWHGEPTEGPDSKVVEAPEEQSNDANEAFQVQAAALLLRGYFTDDDVWMHRNKAKGLDVTIRLLRLDSPEAKKVAMLERERDWHFSMADRIESLVPQ